MKKLMKMVLSAWCLVLGAAAGAAAELPAGYTAVEYIESTPGGGQYIDTEYIPNVNTWVECVVSLSDDQPSDGVAVFGARKGTESQNAFAFFAKTGGNEDLTCFSLGDTETRGTPFYWGRKTELRCEKSMAMWISYLEGRCLIPPASVGTDVCVNTMFIFDVNSAEENAKHAGVCLAVMKLYSFRIDDNNVTVRDFVPCVRNSDFEPGLYDLAAADPSKAFYANAGSGRFQIPQGAIPVVTVGEHPHTTAVWTFGDGSVTNALTGTSFKVAKGTTNVTVIFTPDQAYKLVSGNFVHQLGTVNADVALTGVPQVALKDVEYLDADGRVQTRPSVEVVTGATSKLEDGHWYVAYGRVVRSALEVGGSAHLILIDGCELTVNGGLYVPSWSAITIYGQRGGTGRLNANGTGGNAGIGGRYVEYDLDARYCGSVTINGGRVNANGCSIDPDPERWDYSFDSAGIGGCGNRTGGKVTVNGGRVIADSRSGAAGIGGGSIEEDGQSAGGGGGTVTIRGGTVTASSRYASGIGGGAGAGGKPAVVTISGGSIDASIQNNVQKNSGGAPLRKVTLEMPSINYEKVSFRGLGKYGLRDAVPVNKRVIFYLPDGQYEVVADFDLSGLDTRSRSYVFIVFGHDVVCGPQEFGLKVNNEDISIGFGVGWVCQDNTLSITDRGQYVLSGVSSSGDVQVKVAASDCDVILSDAIIYTQGRPAFVVEPSLTNVSLRMKGGVSHLATTNATDGTSYPALEVKSALTVNFASGADALRSAVYVFNYGDASAIGGRGPVSVAGGHLCAWSDGRAVADTCGFGIASESSDRMIAQAGMSWTGMRIVSGQNPDAPIIEVAPSCRVRVPVEIPGVRSYVVANTTEPIAPTETVNAINVFRVMVLDDITVDFTASEGYEIVSGGLVSIPRIAGDVTFGSAGFSAPDVRKKLTVTLPESLEGETYVVTEAGRVVEKVGGDGGVSVYPVRSGYDIKIVCTAQDGWRIVSEKNVVTIAKIQESQELTAADLPWAWRLFNVTVPAVANVTSSLTSTDGKMVVKASGNWQILSNAEVTVTFNGVGNYRVTENGTKIWTLTGDVTFGETDGFPLPTVEVIPGTIADPWIVGENVTAYTNGTTLVIEGSGAMSNFVNAADVPWNRETVKDVVIGEGVTQVGKNALAGLADAVTVNGTPLSTYRTVSDYTTTINGIPLDDYNAGVRFLNVGEEWQTGPVAAQSPSGSISGAEFERIDIVDGVAYLGVSVYTNSEVKVKGEGEGWGVATNGVIEVPATGKQGFFILMSKPSAPSDAPHSPITILE